MSAADRFRKLAALGLTTEQIAGVLDLMDSEAAESSAREEARKAGARERWHRWRDKRKANVSQHEQTLANNSRASVTRGEDNLQTTEITGQKGKEEKDAREARPPFPEFWAIYPHKVGKREAEAAFLKALKRADLPTILDGVRRYAAKTDDRPWCNPATFLNQDRWADMPAPTPIRQATAPPGKRSIWDAAMDGVNGHGPANIFGDRSDAQRVSAGQSEPRLAVEDLRGGGS